MQFGTYSTSGPVLADTNPTPNTYALRDNAGGMTHAAIVCTQLILNGALRLNWVVKTGPLTYAVQAGPGGDCTIYCDTTSGNVTLTLPPPAVVGTGGPIRVVKKVAANSIIVNPNISETINGAASKTITTQYTVATFESDGTNWIAGSRTVL